MMQTPRDTEQAAPSLVFEDVCFGFRTDDVVSHLSFSVHPGELLCIVGPNGAGKTTLLRLATGYITPRAGRVSLDGRDVSSYSALERAKRIALVPQSEPHTFAYTVRELVLLGRYPHSAGLGFETEADTAACDAALRATQLVALARRPVTHLSGGEQHRAAIARALAQDTPLLLLDEPSAHLDLRHRIALFELLRELCSRGRCAVCVTHDLQFAASYATRVALLVGGTIREIGAPGDVLKESHLTSAFEAPVRVYRDENDGLIVVPGAAPATSDFIGSDSRDILT